MRQIGYISASQCPVLVHYVPSYEELATVVLPSKYTVIFLAGDASRVSTDQIGKVAEHFLAAGLLYVCTWGPDCERVHDIFDECYVGNGRIESTFDFMSTWHSSDSFEEAVEFFTFGAVPADGVFHDLSYLAILVNSVHRETDFTDIVTRMSGVAIESSVQTIGNESATSSN